MAEYNIRPEIVLRCWTEELLQLMLEKRAKRLNMLDGESGEGGEMRVVPEEELFKQMGIKPEVH